jgi:hypothetical protein
VSKDLTALIAAVRSQPWAILPDYLSAIEAIAARALDDDILERIARDGHIENVDASKMAIAAVGTRLEGARMSTIRDGCAVIPVIGAIFPRANMVNASTDGTSLDAVMRHQLTSSAS